MRVACGVLLLALSAFAYDAILFSNGQQLSREHPSFEALVSGASANSPLVFLVEPNFTLGQFSLQASAYSPDPKSDSALIQIVRDAQSSAQRYFEETFHIPSAVVFTSASHFKTGSSVYILAADDFLSLQELASLTLSKFSGYTAVLTNTNAVSKHASRVKRLSSDLVDTVEEDSQQGAQPKAAAMKLDNVAGVKFSLPLSLPAYNRSTTYTPAELGCMLYMEGINIIVSNKKGTVPSAFPSAGATIINGTFTADDSYVSCPSNVTLTTGADFTFHVIVHPTGDAAYGSNVEGRQFVVMNDPIDLQLTFHMDYRGYWSLSQLKLNTPVSVNKADKNAVVTGLVKSNTGNGVITYMGIGAVAGYGFNCGDTPAAWFETDSKDHIIGIGFHNIQIALGGIDSRGRKDKIPHYYNLYMGDCVGTFSTGSLMGIITSLVLVIVFLFGFVMLNSVQTIDRFDDPKQKQILINVRE